MNRVCPTELEVCELIADSCRSSRCFLRLAGESGIGVSQRQICVVELGCE
jgi:hypothetical protein